jgi:bis(5'-nucleosyl)-tetraphosphatase (symmetrical)
MEIKSRTIIVGDIHGCIEEFDELIKTLEYDKESDRLILLGDLIDRGPSSVAVVRRAREMDLECVMGNHEHKFMKWFKSMGSRNDVYDRKTHYTEFADEDVNYIARMSNYIELPDFNTVVAHAGLKSGVKLQNQSKDDLYYLRYVDSDGKFISLKKVSKLGKKAAGAHFWTEFWHGPESVVYGHNVHSYDAPLIEEVSPGVSCYGIDTGCCFGGKLTALIMNTKEIVQVQAKRTYYQSDFDIRFAT